jgi:hypothetical protein
MQLNSSIVYLPHLEFQSELSKKVWLLEGGFLFENGITGLDDKGNLVEVHFQGRNHPDIDVFRPKAQIGLNLVVDHFVPCVLGRVVPDVQTHTQSQHIANVSIQDSRHPELRIMETKEVVGRIQVAFGIR